MAAPNIKKRSRASPAPVVLGLAGTAYYYLTASIHTSDAFVFPHDAAATRTTAAPRRLCPSLRASATAAGGSIWQTLDLPQAQAFQTIFGPNGERGEYMDGYSAKAMSTRCIEDYKWSKKTFLPSSSPEAEEKEEEVVFASERANMMSHLYDNKELWEYVCMVAFAEHYIPPTDDNNDDEGEAANSDNLAKPFSTFQRHKESQPPDRPIFSGVVLSDWEAHVDNAILQKLAAFKKKRIDYVRLECNFGSTDDIGGAAQLVANPRFRERFQRLAEVAKACQTHMMVPLILLQVPWREPGKDSFDYFEQAVYSLTGAFREANVESNKLLLETRPPIGLSSQGERSLPATDRISLGFETGRKMFNIIESAFHGETIAGFCVAGGSTKGDHPTAMEDDTQNGVRQGLRCRAREKWGYELCFWEMGAKLMLQPKVGRLWGRGQSGCDAAREVFVVNAQDLADEIKGG